MRVLVVKTSSMGDVLHTLPALTDAMQAMPDIRFDWVVEEGFAQIPSWHPAVERVLPVAIRRWRKAWFSAPVKAERRAFRDALRAVNYDAVIDAQGLVKSAALVTRLARGVKHGMDWQTAREPLASLFYNRRHHIAKAQHAVERTRELFAKSLGYAKPAAQGDYAIAQHFLRQPAADAGRYVVFLHATTRDEKHWPEAHWRELITLLEPTGLQIRLPWGAPHEEARAKRLAEGFNYVQVLPRLMLEQVAHQLAGARFVVSVDTGLSHLT
ncbi:lipopolysaccharide heptosyltransferase RfaC, partial [Cronobacter malonaticus]